MRDLDNNARQEEQLRLVLRQIDLKKPVVGQTCDKSKAKSGFLVIRAVVPRFHHGLCDEKGIFQNS